MQERHYNLAIGATSLANGSGLGFSAQSCIVQNPTPAWWYLPDQLHYVPPFVINHVVALLGSEVAKVIYQSPPGVTQSITNATAVGQTTSFLFVDSALPPDSGYVGYSAYGATSRRMDICNAIAPGNTLTLSTPATNGIEVVPFYNGAPISGNHTLKIVAQRPGTSVPENLGSWAYVLDNTYPLLIPLPPIIIVDRYLPAGTVLTFTDPTGAAGPMAVTVTY